MRQDEWFRGGEASADEVDGLAPVADLARIRAARRPDAGRTPASSATPTEPVPLGDVLRHGAWAVPMDERSMSATVAHAADGDPSDDDDDRVRDGSRIAPEHPSARRRPAGPRAAEPAADRDAERAARRAERVAMHALTRRGMSRREVERTLRSRELDDDAVEAELARLESVGLVDDHALAQDLVGTLQERKGLGRTAIAAELTRRLLAPAAIEYALDLVDTGDELARARDLAIKRAAQLRSLDRDVAVRRLSAFLARRGYSGGAVRTAVEAALPQNRSRVRFEPAD
jgi:regulatory protein